MLRLSLNIFIHYFIYDLKKFIESNVLNDSQYLVHLQKTILCGESANDL